ncbi:MAG TPA: tail fiber domain-containing protein, partial [Pyrinomonadaceae bacterium]|nr:tail fiber domain-containing protein [Pyrinomonadaceae bacterium]
ALGQAADRGVTLSGSGLSVKWDVAVPHSGLTLTISAPDGQVFRKEFKGRSAEFTLTDAKGDRFADGQYSYELRVTPPIPADVKETLAAARAKGNSEEVQRDLIRRGALPAQPLVVSGGFAILNGSVIVPGALEEGSVGAMTQPRTFRPSTGASVSSLRPNSGAAVIGLRRHHPVVNPFFDFVIADDLIVQGSACVGLDCVDGENFGFDTIRVKENNTRIQYDDTSTSAGFATNNWQIRANAQGSGGGAFLAIVDQGATGNSETGTLVFQVDAGAPANSLRVSSGGNVGIGTATPVLDVHANTTDTPAIRLEQNNSGGFTAQTWDIGANEANFFVRDVTSGSRLPFRIRPGAPTSSIDIAADGDVGIGTGSPDTRLSVLGAGATFPTSYNVGDVATFVTNTDGFANISLVKGGIANPQGLHFGVNQASLFSEIQAARDGIATNVLVLNRQGGNVGIGTSAPTELLSVNGSAGKPGGGSWSVFSDERLKNIKSPFTSGLKAVMQLQPVRYEYKPGNALGIKSEGQHIGFGAKAVQQVIPEAVSETANGYLVVNNDPIIWTMLNAIKEQQREIEKLKSEVRRLRATRRRR